MWILSNDDKPIESRHIYGNRASNDTENWDPNHRQCKHMENL